MKTTRFLIPFFLLLTGVFPALCQHRNTNDENMLKMVVPESAGIEKTAPVKLDGDGTSGPVQILSTQQQRGSGNESGSPSPSAVPGNNDCANAITLTVNAPCINGTNKEATVQSGENTSCQGAVTKTVWYKFIATSGSHYVEVERTASSGCYLSSAVYSGTCLPAAPLSCEDAAFGPNLNIHNLTGLTIGATYLIQVSYTGGSLCGNNGNVNTGANFCIQVGTPQSCSTCGTPCGSLCIFPSAPTVTQVTTTCTKYDLKPRLNAGQSKKQCYTFTAVAASFSLQMIINSVGCSGGNVSTFDWQLYAANNCSSVIQSGNLSNMNAAGLNIGTAYIICYTWTSSCQHNSVYPYIVATSPLPVALLYLEGRQQEKSILLSWATASETNNNHFSVQRSDDGTNFDEIGKVQGAGNSTHLLAYTFTDQNPVKGVNYYRLAQFDYDGTSVLSELIAVRYYENSLIRVENNPVSDQIQLVVQSGNSTNITLEIINHLGEPVMHISKFASKGYNKFLIPVENLADGVYILKMESSGNNSWTRFVKL